jgi:hypothetical protein
VAEVAEELVLSVKIINLSELITKLEAMAEQVQLLQSQVHLLQEQVAAVAEAILGLLLVEMVVQVAVVMGMDLITHHPQEL